MTSRRPVSEVGSWSFRAAFARWKRRFGDHALTECESVITEEGVQVEVHLPGQTEVRWQWECQGVSEAQVQKGK